MENVSVLVVCRQASDSLAPTAVRGYWCRACGRELQVTPDGVRQIASGGTPLCNPCGFARAKREAARGAKVDIVESPLAQAQMATPQRQEKINFGSKSITFERLPSGKLDAFETVGGTGHLPEFPLRLTCDCCLQKVDRLWCYRQRGFSMRIHGRRLTLNEGAWAFCVYCHALYVAGDMAALTARVATLTRWKPEAYAAVYALLPEVLEGPATAWESGQRIPGRML